MTRGFRHGRGSSASPPRQAPRRHLALTPLHVQDLAAELLSDAQKAVLVGAHAVRAAGTLGLRVAVMRARTRWRTADELESGGHLVDALGARDPHEPLRYWLTEGLQDRRCELLDATGGASAAPTAGKTARITRYEGSSRHGESTMLKQQTIDKPRKMNMQPMVDAASSVDGAAGNLAKEEWPVFASLVFDSSRCRVSTFR